MFNNKKNKPQRIPSTQRENHVGANDRSPLQLMYRGFKVYNKGNSTHPFNPSF